jgi:hypothetical protein
MADRNKRSLPKELQDKVGIDKPLIPPVKRLSPEEKKKDE